MNKTQLRLVWEKTNGHCHFCGDAVALEDYGRKGGDKSWVLDHINQRGKGGNPSVENCLAACNECNRRRWHYSGEAIRDVLLMGVIARNEITKNSSIGKVLARLREKRLADNLKRTAKQAKMLAGTDETEVPA